MDVLLRLCPVLTPGSHPEAKQGRGACVQADEKAVIVLGSSAPVSVPSGSFL